MENKEVPMPGGADQDIDLVELARKLWKGRRFILKACGIGAVLGLVVAFSMPKEYKTLVKLSPENSQNNRMSQLGGLAAMAGINLGSGVTGEDALSVDLYPDIVQSSPFLLEFISMPVETQDGKLHTTLYDYLTKHQRTAWWNQVSGAPFKLLAWGKSLVGEKQPERKEMPIDFFRLTKEQEGFIALLGQKIQVTEDKKTNALTGSVTMQDPLVSAMVMDSVLTKLQQYIIDYRTRKAKHDLFFTEKLYTEAKEAYYKMQQAYARYVDSNQHVISASSQAEEERLKNEMDLAFNVYNQMAQQLEMNKVKVQEQTPVYTVIEPARVPLRAGSPNKPAVIGAFLFLAAFLSCAWILIRDFFTAQKK